LVDSLHKGVDGSFNHRSKELDYSWLSGYLWFSINPGRLPNALGERRGPPRPSQPNGYAVRLRGRCRDALRARRAIVRNASLTARVSGKIFATSGSRSTTLVPSAYRAAVTPRTGLPGIGT